MWLVNATLPAALPQSMAVAPVSFAGQGGFAAVGECEYRDIPIFAPVGYQYAPKPGDNLLVINGELGHICLGAAMQAPTLTPGEVRLVGPKGSSILLRSDGGVEINGCVITATGQIIPKA